VKLPLYSTIVKASVAPHSNVGPVGRVGLNAKANVKPVLTTGDLCTSPHEAKSIGGSPKNFRLSTILTLSERKVWPIQIPTSRSEIQVG
jgi:hypothetical protein